MQKKPTPLHMFHFDREKSGRIITAWVEPFGGTNVAKATGIPYDTLNNSKRGRINEISVERVFKIAVYTGHSICEYLQLMLQGESIDFAESVHALKDNPCELVKIQPPVVPDPPEMVDLSKPQPELSADILDRFRALHETSREALVSQHVAETAAITAACSATVEATEKHLHNMQKARNTWRICFFVACAFICYLLWEILNPHTGLTEALWCSMPHQ